jgi:hypothetical protein
MRDILKNSYVSNLPQGTLSLAGFLGLAQGKPFYQTIPEAAKTRRDQEMQQQEEMRKMQSQQALQQYAQQSGNQGLAALIQGGVDPRTAIALEEYLNPRQSAGSPYDNLIKTSDGIYDPYVDPETGQIGLRNLTGNDRNYQELQLQSASERNQYNKKLGEVSKTYKGALGLDEELEKLDKYFDNYNRTAPGFAKSGNVGARYAPELSRLFSGKEARTASDVIGKFKEDIKLKYVQQAGTPRLKILGETLVNAIPNLGQSPEAQKEIVANLREMINKEIFISKFLNEWKKYAPGRLGEGEVVATDLLSEMNLFDNKGKLKNVNMPRLVRDQFDRLYNSGSFTEQSVIEEQTFDDVDVSGAGANQDEEDLALIRKVYPSYGR